MKKIYSIIAAIFVAASAMAQVSVTVNGETVSDGQTIDLVFTDIKEEIIPGVMSMWEMKPEIIVTSEAAKSTKLAVEVLNKVEGLQNCFNSCTFLSSNNNYYNEQTVEMTAGQQKDAQIHWGVQVKPDTNPVVCNFRVTVSQGFSITEFTVNMSGYYDGLEPDGIATVEAAAKSKTAFNLNGQRLANGKGLVIVGGKKFMKN